MRVYNNTLSRNETNVKVFDDSRVNSNPLAVAKGVTWITHDVLLRNNIFSNSTGNEPMVLIRDFNSVPIRHADDMVGDANYNAYYRTVSSKPAVLVEWWRGKRIHRFQQLRHFQSKAGLESRGVEIDDVADNPFFQDEMNGDYRLRDSSVARHAGAPLPAEVAKALGLAPGVAVDLGAIQSPSAQ